MAYKKWEVIVIEYGTPLNNFNYNTPYYKQSFKNGINVGLEFSLQHYGIIISPTYLNTKKVVVLPITGKQDKYNCNYDNIFCLDEKINKFLSKKSVVLLNDIRSISVNRISRFKHKETNEEIIYFISKQEQKHIIKKFNNFFWE